jgi:catechol 2,3-dioxygenase-like lactoylglutathione lyase family enzyme
MTPAPGLGFIILYVEDTARSAGFYAKLLAREPVEASPSFVLFPLPSGIALGLWSRHGVEPLPTGGPGGGELAFTTHNVDAVHADWVTALDPDGHRLRVFAPAAG